MNMKIERHIDLNEIRKRITNFKVTAILGPRQSGKTTIAKEFESFEYFDLENPRDLRRLDNPQLALEQCNGLIVIDEIQRKPDLFPLIRHLVDHNPNQSYLILGSASRDLIKQSSESLAGRISFFTLMGFRKDDVGKDTISKLWFRGGLPPSYLAVDDNISNQWRLDYIRTFLERDIPNLGIRIPADTLRRFWQMISFYHGQIVNFSELGRSFGISDTTIRHYLEILQGTFMIRLLQPWYINIGKRLVKRPKLYFRDTGLLHALLNIDSEQAMQYNPKLGGSWEGFAVETIIRNLNLPEEQIYFWSTHSGAEVDLFWQQNGKNWACEAKFTDAPKLTKSMQSAVESLELEHLWIVYPGTKKYQLTKQVTVLPISSINYNWNYDT